MDMGRRHWGVEDLTRRRKGDPQRTMIALRLRQETTMTWDGIAEKLAMGAGAYAAHWKGVTHSYGLTPLSVKPTKTPLPFRPE